MSGNPDSLCKDQNRTVGLITAGGLGVIAIVRYLLAGTVTWWLIAKGTPFLAAGLLVPGALARRRCNPS